MPTPSMASQAKIIPSLLKKVIFSHLMSFNLRNHQHFLSVFNRMLSRSKFKLNLIQLTALCLM